MNELKRIHEIELNHLISAYQSLMTHVNAYQTEMKKALHV